MVIVTLRRPPSYELRFGCRAWLSFTGGMSLTTDPKQA